MATRILIPSTKRTFQKTLIEVHVAVYMIVHIVYNHALCVLWFSEAVRTDESRQEFITEKYIEMKYASAEDKERILRERQEARDESVRRSTKVTSQKGRVSLSC